MNAQAITAGAASTQTRKRLIEASLWLSSDPTAATDASNNSEAGVLALAHLEDNVDIFSVEGSSISLGVSIDGIPFGCSTTTVSQRAHHSGLY